MRRTLKHAALMLAALMVLVPMLVAPTGCGGTAVLDDGRGSSGNAPPTDDPIDDDPVDPPLPHCQTAASCCAEVCAAAETVACWQPDDRCECGLGSGDGCDNAWLAFANCLLDDFESVVVCDASDIVLRCDACEPQRLLVESACARDISCLAL
jgi:hypothetical protein